MYAGQRTGFVLHDALTGKIDQIVLKRVKSAKTSLIKVKAMQVTTENHHQQATNKLKNAPKKLLEGTVTL